MIIKQSLDCIVLEVSHIAIAFRNVSWNEAAAECHNQGGTLPEINSPAEADLLTELINTYVHCEVYNRIMTGQPLIHMLVGDVTFVGVLKKKVFKISCYND